MSKPRTQEAPSILMALHHRYEQSLAEYEIIDSAHQAAKVSGDNEAFLLENAGHSSVREADALRMAILYQVPGDIRQAAVLQFHIGTMHDMIEGCADRRELEEDALKVAIQTLFDFLACEMKEDHEQFAGASFRDEAVRAYFARNRRTGGMEV
jgi:hypothetical protein